METPLPERRKDVDTRKVIEVVTEHIDMRLDERLKGFVTWQGLAGSVVGLVGLIFVVVSAFMAPVKESAIATRAEMKDARKDLGEEVRELRMEFKEEVHALTAEVKAVRSVTVDGHSRGRAQEELRRTTITEDR